MNTIEDRNSASNAINRMKHFQELMDVDSEDLHILIDAKYREKESELDNEFLPEEEQYWELLIYGTDERYLGSSEENLNFNITMNLEDVETDTFLNVVYPNTVKMFEEEYGEDVGGIQYYDPDNL